MKFIWEDGQISERDFGYKVVGLKRKGKRPYRLLISKTEINNSTTVKEDRLQHYLHILRSSLDKRDGGNDIEWV